jgi:hypothetical protein
MKVHLATINANHFTKAYLEATLFRMTPYYAFGLENRVGKPVEGRLGLWPWPRGRPRADYFYDHLLLAERVGKTYREELLSTT